jgi:hypothetical protein
LESMQRTLSCRGQQMRAGTLLLPKQGTKMSQ